MDEAEVLRGFPTALHDDVLTVARSLPPPSYPAFERREELSVGSDTIEIPYRVHRPEPEADALETMSINSGSWLAVSIRVTATVTSASAGLLGSSSRPSPG